MNKKITLASVFALLAALIAKPAAAICPICTIAVASGVGFSRYLGIDDTISGLWIGGLIVSMIAWTINWFDKKKFNFRGRDILTIIAYIALIVVPLYFYGMLDNSASCVCGINRLLLGMTNGAIGFWFGADLYVYLKAKNNGHAHFPFEKVVLPISPLLILSIIFYFLTK
ncbi:MAG TPA: hypothetical protein PKN62_01695 [bacterium]|nr:hypothetical protein [bacterium]